MGTTELRYRLSPGTLLTEAAALATILNDTGIGHGDCVAILLPNSLMFAVALYAAGVGAIAVNCDTRLTS